MSKIKNIVKKYKGGIICFFIVVLSIISIVIQDIDKKKQMIVNKQEITINDGEIGVYITGAVKNPGVYFLKNGSRIYNLLDICGGVNDNADIGKLNLAQKLNDSDKIDVPIKKEEKIQEDNDVEMEEDEYTEESDDKVNINSASKEELKTLNGIGDSTAEKIIEYRKYNRFEQIEDIMNVSGIGDAKFNNIKDYICVK